MGDSSGIDREVACHSECVTRNSQGGLCTRARRQHDRLRIVGGAVHGRVGHETRWNCDVVSARGNNGWEPFPAVFQSVFVAPLQVLAAANTGVDVKNNSKPPSNTAAIGPA